MDGTQASQLSGQSTNGVERHGSAGLFDLAGLRARIGSSDSRLASALVWIAAFLAAACMFYSFVIPQTPGRMGRPSAELIPALPLWSFASQVTLPGVGNGLVIGILLIVVGVGAFAAYGLGVYLTWRRPPSRRAMWVIFAAALVLVNISMWALPNVSTDIFNYMMRGRVAAVYDEIPYYTAADEFPDDPIYPYASHRYTGNPGGKFPTWMLLNITLASLGNDDPVTSLMVYRIVLAAMTLGSVMLVAMILRELSPKHVLAGTILFGWSPIVFTFGPGKTDTVMVFFLLLGAYLLSRNRPLIAVLPLTLSCFVKLISLPLVGILFARQILDRRWREVVIGGILFVMTTLFIYAPFSDGFDLMLSHLKYVEGKGGSSAPNLFRPVLKYAFFAVVAWSVFRKPRTLDGTLQAWALTMLYFSMFLTNFAFAWYLMAFVALAAIARDGRIVVATIVLGTSSFIINSWNSTSTSTFPLVTVGALSRHVVYLLPLAVGGGALAAFAVWRKSRASHGAQA